MIFCVIWGFRATFAAVFDGVEVEVFHLVQAHYVFLQEGVTDSNYNASQDGIEP